MPYTTLTRFCRERGIGVLEKERAGRIVTGPGVEMQHDTSPYTIEIGGKKVKRQCASLVLGYSRRMYIRFYAKFDRFACKVFLTEAFKAMGGTCGQCVIDNSHVVIVCGTGKNAQVSPEMEAFEKRFGFKFLAHELGHADRSGKVERDFWYVERNFLAGRTFKDDADLNLQAQAWLDEKADVRHLRELGASPRELFVAERPHIDLAAAVRARGLSDPPARGGRLRVRSSACDALLGAGEIAGSGGDGTRERQGGGPAAGPRGTGAAPEADGRRWSQSVDIAGAMSVAAGASQGNVLPEETRLRGLGGVMPEYLTRLKADRGSHYAWSLRRLYGLCASTGRRIF